MILSDISIKRPVFASVISLLLFAFGFLSYERLPLREYPNIDPPKVSIRTNYPGAAASIVETRITKVIEDRISGVQGIRYIQSYSENGRSVISIEFDVGIDMDAAANDVRDNVSRIVDNLPEEADAPDIEKVSADDDVILWFNFTGENMSMAALSDYARRYLVDRFSVVEGVARVRVGGEQRYAMRIWLDRQAMAARQITVADVEAVLRSENVEFPAGSIESKDRLFTVRMVRNYLTAEDFAGLAIRRGDDGYLVRLGDVARVERGTEEDRTLFRGNGIPQVGIGITKQSTANTIDVARGVKAEQARINATLPEGMRIENSYDSSVFVEQAIADVYVTLGIAIVLVVLVIYLFLGSFRAMLIPAVAVPLSLISTFSVLAILGFSVNLLTLLALVLAIGLVVDDAIVVLENIVRHMDEKGKPPLLAAYDATREVGFAVIATTLVLIAVFVPIVFLQGDIGRLFSEFSITMAVAVSFSSLIALTLSPVLASKLLRRKDQKAWLVGLINQSMLRLRMAYVAVIRACLRMRWLVIIIFIALVAGTLQLAKQIPSEYAPKEDRGTFYIFVKGPEGATYAFMEDYMNQIEARLMTYVDSEEINRLMVRAPRSFGSTERFNSGIIIAVMNDWSRRRPAAIVMKEIRQKLGDLAGVRVSTVMRQGFTGRNQKPVQFVVGGGTYAELAQWRDILLAKIEADNPGLESVDADYEETKPQVEVQIDTQRAADLGVSVTTIGRTLETMLGSRKVTTYQEEGEEYDLILQGEQDEQRTVTSLQNLYVRSAQSGALIPLANLVTLTETADASRLNRYNRVRALTIEADLAEGLHLGDALTYLENLVRSELPDKAVIDYKGLSRDYFTSGGSILFMFLLGILVTYLVLAAQFESYIHPFVIMLTVPLAMAGGALGLYLTEGSFNLYSQIGMIMLIGLAAKNGILIVEFANQLRDRGASFEQALLDAASARLRPILMTSLTAVAGAIPLVIASGAGSEARFVIGVVIISGVLLATFLTLFVVPVAYDLLARHTGSPGDVARRLSEQEIVYSPTEGIDQK